MNEDDALLRAYVEKGSEDAFTSLVQKHVDLVYSAALRRIGGNVHPIRAAVMPDLSTAGHGLFDRFPFVKFEQPKSTIELGHLL